jgi:CheY-like chemotaxis protein
MDILILDHHPEFTDALSIALRFAGYSSVSFASPKQALAVISDYDILITNYQMPEMTGLEVARQAYSLGWRGSLLLMSDHSAAIEESPEHPLLRGILRKPFSYDTLQQALSVAVLQKN